MAIPKLKKGTEIYLLTNWNRKGTVTFSRWIVDSCGAKQMHIRAADGSMLRDRLYVGEEFERRVYPVAEVSNVEELALEYAREIRETEIAGYNRILAKSDTTGQYREAIEKNLRAVEEAAPRAITREVAHAEVRAKIEAEAGRAA